MSEEESIEGTGSGVATLENTGPQSNTGGNALRSRQGEISEREPGSASSSEEAEPLIPTAANEPATSYSMLEPRMKRAYGAYYKELYYTPERRVLSSKVQELISLAASLVAHCEGCIDGHMKKALASGATKEEISETISIAAAISAAAMVDLSDRCAARLGLNHFPSRPPRKSE